MKPKSFNDISSRNPAENVDFNSSLVAWYKDVWKKPFLDFSIEDMCRTVREKLFLDEVFPIIFDYLKFEPLAGEMYDGELIISVINLPDEFWRDKKVLRNNLKELIKENLGKFDDEFCSELKTFINIQDQL